MLPYILKRLLLMIPTLFGICLLTFIVIQFVPGGPIDQMIAQLRSGGTEGEAASGGGRALDQRPQGLEKEQLDYLRKLYEFDQPVHIRFVRWMVRLVTFNFGESYYHHKTVVELVKSKMPVSISLGVSSFLITYLVCIPLGIRKAVKDGTPFDTVSSVIVMVGYSIPGFVLAIALIVLFGGGSFWSLFPLRGLTSDNFRELTPIGKILDYLWHLVLPLSCYMIGSFSVLTMLTKNSFMDEINKQYVMTARSKGLAESVVLFK
ncbi:MAG: ABC transporter permease subunit, partial [Candidatus Tectomicrobia bacterium]|nr:ABC transporter permease subunit [Candidatus Tectomicrobia bacterium]